MRKILLLLATLTLSFTFAQDFVMGITFDAGGKFDKSFNEGTWRGMVSAIEELEMDVEIDLLEFEGTPDTAAEGQRRIALQGAELIVAPGFLQTDAIQAVSSEFPDTNFVLIDSVADNPNVRSVLFKEHEGSYLVRGELFGGLYSRHHDPDRRARFRGRHGHSPHSRLRLGLSRGCSRSLPRLQHH
jgi:basic membrane protein A